MYCTCGNQQCFVCSANVAGYDHFDKNQGGTGAQDCPLYDDTAKRLRDEVAAAQVNAVTEVLQKRSDLTAEEVTVDDTLAGNNREPLATTEREAKLMGLDKVARHYAGPMYFDFEATERRQELLQEAGRTERRRVRREERQRLEDERQRREREEQRVEQARLERERLEAERKEEQEALEAVKAFEEQQRLQDLREMEEAMQAVSEEEKWRNFLQLSSIVRKVASPHPQELKPFEIEGYWAQLKQELHTYINMAREYEVQWDALLQWGQLSEIGAKRLKLIKDLLTEALRASQRLTEEAEMRRRNSERMAAQLERKKAEALKQRIKARQTEKKELKAPSANYGGVSKWKMIWKKPGQVMSSPKNIGG